MKTLQEGVTALFMLYCITERVSMHAHSAQLTYAEHMRRISM